MPGKGTEALRCFEEYTILYIVDKPPGETPKTTISKREEFKIISVRSY